jgi:hypothetical protein
MPLRAKLVVGHPDDPLEREADSMAAQVMRTPGPSACGPSCHCAHCQDQQDHLRRSPTDNPPAAVPSVAPPIVHDVLKAPGQPLAPGLRAAMEGRFGQDFSAVRLHTGPEADHSATAVGARAYTVGSDIVFGAGQYAPATIAGQHLLAHELTHVLQQRGAPAGALNRTPAVHRTGTMLARQEEGGGTARAEFLKAGWIDVNDLGIVYQPGQEPDGGARLREFPDKDSRKLRWLPQNTRVFILKHNPAKKWYAVTTVGAGGGEFGYIAEWLIMRNLPDPDAEVHKLQSGETPLEVAKKHYAKKGFDVWGKDARYVVNALVWVNSRAKHNFPGESGIKKPGLDYEWWTASTTAGVYIWLPGANFLNAIYEQVAEHGGGTGSLTADLWRGIKKAYEYVAYGLAFVGGLVHGFVKSIWDAVAGLVETIVDVLVSIFTGNVVTDAKELWEAISKLTWKDIKAAVGAWWEKWEKKLMSSSPWEAGHAHGYLTGYIMAEAAQLLLTAGTLAAAKSALWSSRLGKAIQGTRAYQKFAKGIETVGATGAKTRKLVEAAGEALRHSKAFTSLKVAREWAVQALKLTAEFVKDLTLDGINRLRQLSDAMLQRLSRLSNRAKRWLLGCASDCKIDLDKIKKTLANLTDEDIEKFVSEIGEKAESPAVTGGKRPMIDDKRVPTKKRRRLEAEDIPRRKDEKLADAAARVQRIVGKKVSDHASFKKAWERAREHVLKSKTLTKDNVAEVYAAVRKRFWGEIWGDEDALKVLRESGFYLPQEKGSAAFLGGVKPDVPRQEITLSLDHAFEKARGENWKIALEPDNLVFEFHNPNSFREIVQMRHPELRTP